MIRLFVIFLLLAPQLPAQEPRVVSLGLGRSRLEFVLAERVPCDAKSEAGLKLGDLSFRERWLQRELPRLVPGLEAVDVLERVIARSNASGIAATRDRILEITGPDEAIREAERRLRQIVVEPKVELSSRTWVVLKNRKDELTRTGPQLLDEAELTRRMEELASSEDAQIIETAGLRFLNGSDASISVGNRLTYVSDYRVSSSGGAILMDPVVDFLQEGLLWEMGALREPETGKIHLAAELLLSRVKKPLERLVGKIGSEGQKIVIEKPIVAETRWSVERLVLDPEHRGFRVGGIRLLEPDRKVDEPLREVEILCQIEVVRPRNAEDGGTVQGFDADARIAFVRIAAGTRLKGDLVIFERDGTRVAEGRIDEVMGNLVSVRVVDGTPKVGDRVK